MKLHLWLSLLLLAVGCAVPLPDRGWFDVAPERLAFDVAQQPRLGVDVKDSSSWDTTDAPSTLSDAPGPQDTTAPPGTAVVPCTPCLSNAECNQADDQVNACAPLGKEGSFCGSACSGAKDCLPGYACQEVQDVKGKAAKLCRPESGACSCSEATIALGAKTQCSWANSYGICLGARLCTASGLTPCDAPSPAARDCKNGKDNDCNGTVDAQEDGDGDGYAGCQDCNDYDSVINPSAMEYPADQTDNDCDGATDEAALACDVTGIDMNSDADYAKAIDLCAVITSTFPTLASPKARAIKQKFGKFNGPRSGSSFVVLSTGMAAAQGQPGYVLPQSGTSFTNTAPYPKVNCQNSGTVYDFTEWKLTLKVPSNAQALSFDFFFLSSEYPEYVGTQFNDKFVAVLDSKGYKGNISLDAKGNCVSINNAFFQACNGCALGAALLEGTGYEGGVGGGTGWLTTTAPVTPGETITVRLMIWDEGDHIYDSVVFIDGFRWQVKSVTGGPSTGVAGG